MAQLDGRLLQRAALLVRRLGNLRRLVVADMRVQRGDQHQRLSHQLLNPSLIRLNALDAVDGEGGGGVGKEANRAQHIRRNHRLEDVQLKMALRAANGGRYVIALHLGADHGQGLALRRVDLPGHDAAAGLQLGQQQLADAGTGAAGQQADIIGDLIEAAGDGVESARQLDHGVVGGQRLKFVRGGAEGQSGNGGHLPGDRFVPADLGVEAGADGGAADGEAVQPRLQGRLHAVNAQLHLGGIAGELLAEGERRGVLQVSATDLDDAGKLALLRLQGGLQFGQRRQQHLHGLHAGGDVHRRGVGVIGGLRLVDVVIRVDRAVASFPA